MNNSTPFFTKSLLCIVVLSVLTPAWAQEVSTEDDEIEIIITAGRKAQSLKETLVPSSVITREEIERTQASSTTEVLDTIPGISLKSSGGGLGKQTSVYLRGTNSGHALVLVDGVKIGSATLGTSSLQHLPLTQIERIEVVRGPRSSLYGSEAIGGVIQIFTRKGTESSKGFAPQASIAYGSNNTRQASANLAAGGYKGWFNLGVAHESSDGIDVLEFYNAYPPPDYAPVTTYENDKDGYTNNSVSLRAGYRFENQASAELSFLNAQGDTEFDGSFTNETDFRQQVINGQFKLPVGDKVDVTARLGQSRDESEQFKDGEYRSTFDTKRQTASLQADTRMGSAGKLSLGADYQNDEVDGSTDYEKTSRDNTGLFASYQNRWGSTSMDAAVRRDDNEQFGDKVTGSAALGYEWNDGLQARLSYGTAFKAPTFNDLYYPNSGNPNLSPEESANIEVGLSGQLGTQGNWSINAFQNDIDNLIAWQDTGGGVFQPQNVDEAQIRGLELAMNTQAAGWRLGANATLQQPEVAAGANEGNRLPYRAEQLLNLMADRDFGRWSMGATVHAEGDRPTSAFNSTYLGGFGTLDLRAAYQVNRNVKVGLKVKNVFDKDYQLTQHYNQEGINGMITLEYRPQ